MTSTEVVTGTFRVMGGRAEVGIVGGPAGLVEVAHRSLATLEQRWSRYRPDSDVSLLNAAGGVALGVHPTTIRLVEAMVQGWSATDGAYDPTLLPELVRCGGGGPRRPDGAPCRSEAGPVPSIARSPSWSPDAIRLDPDHDVVRLPAGATLDPNGIAKGLAADLVSAELVDRGARDVMVNVGGDVRARSADPARSCGWDVDVAEHPDALAGDRIRIVDGGIATSGTTVNRWTVTGATSHHLIDPFTGRSADHGVIACTVVAGTGAWAEVLTKVCFARGAAAGLELLAERGVDARVQLVDGSVLTTPGWSRFRTHSIGGAA